MCDIVFRSTNVTLPMYLAAIILNEEVDAYRQRLEKATERLKDCSKLKGRCKLALSLNFEL